MRQRRSVCPGPPVQQYLGAAEGFYGGKHYTFARAVHFNIRTAGRCIGIRPSGIIRPLRRHRARCQ